MRRLTTGAVVAAAAALLTLGVMVVHQPARSSEPARPADPNRWAVVIGVDHFEGRTHPNVGAVGDAHLFAKVLTERGWDPQHVMLLTDGDATQANIRAAFAWLAQHATDHSFSVVHYSGHVHQQSINGVLHQQLWPHDNQFIVDSEFADAMRAVPGHMWIDVAGCEAGGFDDGVSAPNRLFTASSQVNEKSYENPPWHESVFSGMQVDQAIEQHMADNNHDGYVSINEAFGFAYHHAPEMTAQQSAGPQHPYSRGGDGSEWFLETPPE